MGTKTIGQVVYEGWAARAGAYFIPWCNCSPEYRANWEAAASTLMETMADPDPGPLPDQVVESDPARSADTGTIVGPLHGLVIQYAHALGYAVEFKPCGGVVVSEIFRQSREPLASTASLTAARMWLEHRASERIRYYSKVAAENADKANSLTFMFASSRQQGEHAGEKEEDG